jgi:hypothetical protein
MTMKNNLPLITIAATLVLSSCQTPSNNANNNTMDKEKIKSEIIQTENELLKTYRQGDFLKALTIEVESPDFRAIVNGRIDNYSTLAERYKKVAADKLVKSLDYQIENQDFNFINSDNVLVTLKVKLTTTMSDGTAITKPLAETILWQRIDNKWKLGHYHATEIPIDNLSK